MAHTKKENIIIIILILSFFFFEGSRLAGTDHPDPRNPFHDVFYKYFNYDIKNAKKILKEQFSNPKFKARAYINYGLINEYENNYKRAEKYYRRALNMGDNIAYVYLLNLYKNRYPSRYLSLLRSMKDAESDYWIDYETAVYYLKIKDKENAIKYLKSAVRKGFYSTTLLLKDPIFKRLRKSKTFKRLTKKAMNNSYRKKSLSRQLREDEYEFTRQKPYGMIKELQIVSYLDKTGRDEKAMEMLSSILNLRIPFRDRNIALFRMARIKAKNGERWSAKKYLEKFVDHLESEKRDKTGYKNLITPLYKDIILNDRFLKNL